MHQKDVLPKARAGLIAKDTFGVVLDESGDEGESRLLVLESRRLVAISCRV